MNNVLRNVMILALSLLLFEACKKDDVSDVTAPEANVTSPQANTTFYRGNTLMLSATFIDDVELKECTIYLNQQLKATRGWDDPWSPEPVTFTLSGQKDEITNQYLFATNIPIDIMSADYLLVVVAVDQALNYSRTVIPIRIE